MFLGLHLPEKEGGRTAADLLLAPSSPLNQLVMKYLDQMVPETPAAVWPPAPLGVRPVTDFSDQDQLRQALLHNERLLASKKVPLGKILNEGERNWMAFAQTEYANKRFGAAEYVWTLMRRGGNLSAGISLAQMIRRRETVLRSYADAYALNLLDDMHQRIPTHAAALANLALLFAINLEPTRVGWEKGLSFIRSLTRSGTYEISTHWENLGRSGDPEGDLLHLMLLWEGKLEYSPLGSFLDLYRRLCAHFPDFPQRCGLELPAKGADFHAAHGDVFPILFSLWEQRYQFVVCLDKGEGEEPVLIDKIGDFGSVGICPPEYTRIERFFRLLELEERELDLS